MIRGLYTAASGMMSASVQMDTLANNLANVNTVGFKKNGVNFRSFPELMIQRVSAQGTQSIGSVMTGSKVQSTAVNYTQGAIHQTGNPLDLAIQGDGFFVVKNPKDAQGQALYTRNGAFTLNPEGNLVNLDGYLVMDDNNQPINIPANGEEIKITDDGLVTAGEQIFATLKVTRFENQASLEKQGDNLFRATADTKIKAEPTADDPAGYSIFQRSLEMGNVNVVGELINNITGVRLYEMLQKNIQLQNSTLEKAVNEVGRYR